MEHTTKIAVVVVTYNRKELLMKSLRSILQQTQAVTRIFVIDNASTDGTREFFEQEFGMNPLVCYRQLDQNTGSAGGFHEGVKDAYEWGADWVWLLDDDVAPTPSCLETMLSYEHISHCIHPSKVDSEGREFVWEALFSPATAAVSFLNNTSFKNGKAFTFVNIGCFEGMLIHRDVIARIGYPDKRFFIVGDDVVYGFMASLYTNVIFVKDARLDKLIPFSARSSPISLYYGIRNHFLFKEYVCKLGLYKPALFYLYFIPLVITTFFKQTARARSLKVPHYVCKGLLHGVQKRFYRL